jgi:type IV pilus assembly protein PilP
MRFKSQILPFALIVFLAACGRSQNDDLTQFMNDANQTLLAPVEALPEVLVFAPKVYNADGLLHDPFYPRKTAIQNANQPDLNRPKEPLEAYPLESLKFVGVLSKKNSMFATIQTPDSHIYQIKTGAHLGEKFGVVTALGENPNTLKYELKVKETIQDPVTAEWSEQMTTLELQEHQ